MRVSLIYPTLRYWEEWPPLSLAHLAAFLEKDGHEVEIIDRNVLLDRHKNDMPRADADTREALERFRPQMVGITATTPLVPDAFKCARLAKEILPDSTVIMGGAHASVLPERTLEECDAVDLVCKGEGEHILTSLAAGARPETLRGIYCRCNGVIQSAGDRSMARDFDSLPHPAYHLIDMKRYLKPSAVVVSGVEVRAMPIYSGRGCPGKCTFCAAAKVNGPGLRLHSAEYIIDEIRRLADEYGVEAIYFVEEMFLVNHKRFEKICNWLIESGYNRRVMCCANARVDYLTEEKLALLRRAGFVQLQLGVESGSQRTLSSICKGTKVEQNATAIAMAMKAGIRVVANIIVGIPGETLEDIRETRSFLKRTKPDVVFVSLFTPYPGSRIYDELKAAGMPDHSWESYTITDTTYNYCEVDDRTFVREFLKLRLRYQVSNTLNSIKFNFFRHPLFTLKAPYYFLRAPIRYAWRKTTRRFRRAEPAEAGR